MSAVKRVIVTCLIAFIVGCAGGGAIAYATNQNGLRAGIGEIYDNWKISKFIDKQEEERPDGLAESKIETGSKYTGITYNAPAKKEEKKEETKQETVTAPSSDTKEKTGLFAGITGHFSKDTQKDNQEQNAEEPAPLEEKIVKGRIAIQNGSLNIRAQGSSDGQIIGQAHKDDIVQIHEQEGAWYRITTENGLNGYVSASYVEVLQ